MLAALLEKFDGCLCEVLRAAHREMEPIKKDRCHYRLDSVLTREGPSDRQYEDIILQCLPPEYDVIHETHSQTEDCNLVDIRRMMSKFYANNLTHTNAYSSRGVAGRGIAMQTTGWDFSTKVAHYCNKFIHYKNSCTDFKAVHQQN